MGPGERCLAAARGCRRPVASALTWPARDQPHGGQGGPVSRPIRDVADGRGRPIAEMQRTAESKSGRVFFHIRQTARLSASLLLFSLPWHERLGVAFGWF
jgi:hypothetical protein